MLVPVAGVGRMPVSAVDVVEVRAVFDGLMSATSAVLVRMVLVNDMPPEGAFVPMLIV